ncbi:DgyrCDS7055 [Dimorphilus gyrociliatus]|uniref:DgyrCDS7055 n=1 Tax=Dimorphilus gyrociliatus TaxID=2664684 RepID=A0A7I8VQ34_9ANNE|nr:DgyrCDS7055 [Dimorphilus gyrociliatus]
MFTLQGSYGFYKAPVSKFILGTICIGTGAATFPLSNHKDWFTFNATDLITSFSAVNVLRYFLYRFVFLSLKDAFSASILITQFRVFERRYSSRYYTNHLIAVSILFCGLELLTAGILKYKFETFSYSQLPSGPWQLIFPLFIPFFWEIPRVPMTTFMHIPVTGKSFVYILGLHMCSTDSKSTLLAFLGLLVGVLHKNNFGYIRTFVKVPKMLSSLSKWLIGSLIESKPPENLDAQFGATLEIQREEQMDRLEMMFNRNLIERNRLMGGQRAEPSQELVNQLVEMGFSRDRAENVLRQTDGDMNAAMSLLLAQ